MNEEPAARAPVDAVALVRDALLISALLTAPASLVATLLGSADLGISLAIGWMIGALNLVLLARGIDAAIRRTLAGIDEARRERGEPTLAELDGEADPRAGAVDPALVRRPSGAGGAVRLALGLAAVVALLWLHPERPEGLAIGVVFVLTGLGASAGRHNRRR
ncbi:MAG: hypothetical protein KC457_07650 [Myxococcales bacterium]|nr:hypothetical protein [Myxococcales bacterium]